MEQSSRFQLNHGVFSAWLGPSYEKRGNRWLDLRLLVLFLLIVFLFGRRGLLFFLFVFTFFAFATGFLNFRSGFFRFRLGLQVGELIGIAIEVEQLRDTVGLAQ